MRRPAPPSNQGVLSAPVCASEPSGSVAAGVLEAVSAADGVPEADGEGAVAVAEGVPGGVGLSDGLPGVGSSGVVVSGEAGGVVGGLVGWPFAVSAKVTVTGAPGFAVIFTGLASSW